MNFEPTERTKAYITRVAEFMREFVYPAEAAHLRELQANRWAETATIRAVRERARTAGLWNLFLPVEYQPFSPGLTNLEYAPLAELMGRSK